MWTIVSEAESERIQPLVRAHAHNDYEHQRPLLDALARGFCSVEADIYLVSGELLVAHDFARVSKERTLAKLYLDPLRERVRQGNGWVFTPGTSIWLLIDIKSDARATFSALRGVLQPYGDMLTEFRPGGIHTNAVTVVVSGNRDLPLIIEGDRRWAAVDGRLADLGKGRKTTEMPLISENWRTAFKWRGTGEMPADENEALRELVRKTHAEGKRLRFWGTPDTEPMWEVLRDAQVDLINTDQLGGLAEFLSGRGASPGKL